MWKVIFKYGAQMQHSFEHILKSVFPDENALNVLKSNRHL